ncbi:MAG TPA: 3-oxoacyl-ACP synthase III family protein [Candidatus Paceibacterota bacterium]|nr:3-oxoacyl-ACP synthase III family protein [Candidatus Paceibacterota bacterium]
MPIPVITGCGMSLPPVRATNEEIYRYLPKPTDEPRWTPDWVYSKLGIITRTSSFDFTARTGLPDYDLTQSVAAARMALDDAGVAASDIDRVYWATTTPRQLLPDPACTLHARLGMREKEEETFSSAVGLTAVGCGGFLFALDLADSDIRAGKRKRLLVVGSVSPGSYITAYEGMPSPEREGYLSRERAGIYIFGEGAAAFVVEASDRPGAGILRSSVGVAPTNNPIEYLGGGSLYPATHATVSAYLHRFNMDTRLIAREASHLFRRILQEMQAATGLTMTEFDRFIIHQVNHRLLERITTENGIPIDRVEVHVERYGNLDTATVPVAYTEAKQQGRIRSGDLVLLAAIGAGWQYGTAVVRVP